MSERLSRKISACVHHADGLIQAGLVATIRSHEEFNLTEITQQHPLESVDFSNLQEVDVFVSDYASAMSVLARRARFVSPGKTPVLIVGGSARDADIRRAMSAGVMGYLLPGCSIDDVLKALRAVASGDCFLSEGAGQVVAEGLFIGQLTERQIGVLKHLQNGLCNKDIARELGITVGTVKSHMGVIFDKLKVDNRTRALVVAARRGILDDPAEPVRPTEAIEIEPTKEPLGGQWHAADLRPATRNSVILETSD